MGEASPRPKPDSAAFASQARACRATIRDSGRASSADLEGDVISDRLVGRIGAWLLASSRAADRRRAGLAGPEGRPRDRGPG